MKRPLTELAQVIRSKNSGPFELTLDIMFAREEDFVRQRELNFLTAEKVAALYRVPVEDVLSIRWFAPARAVKATLKRPRASGAPGDADVYGAQQHAPLLTLECEVLR